MPIIFHYADVKISLKHKRELKSFIQKQVAGAGKQIVNISYVFCSDEYLLNINKKFLNHNFYTDIITFPLSDNPKQIESEIYISVERVRENSLRFAKSEIRNRKSETDDAFEVELHRVMFHGILHLLGYKDKTKIQQTEMRKMEDLWLNKYDKYLK